MPLDIAKIAKERPERISADDVEEMRNNAGGLMMPPLPGHEDIQTVRIKSAEPVSATHWPRDIVYLRWTDESGAVSYVREDLLTS